MGTSRSTAHRELEALFPHLGATDYEITSPENPQYNCIAWAFGETDRWWQYDATTSLGIKTYWPSESADLPPGDTVEEMVKVFELLGFKTTRNRGLRRGLEKVAIYGTADGQFGHVARQIESGKWSSKLGELHDIEHEIPEVLECEAYGTVVLT